MMMHENSVESQALDGVLFDLLVDGELDPARRDVLLLRLDTVPDGWRRCALAFLEAQAWRSDMRAAIATPAETQPHHPNSVVPARSRFARARRLAVAALAMLFAFSAGWLLRPAGEGSAEFGGAGRAVVPPLDMAQSEAKSEKLPDKESDETPSDLDTNPPQLAAAMRMAGILTLQMDDHGKTREVQVPVLDASGIDVRRLLEQSPAGRSAAIQALERRGHKVDLHRQLLTVDLKDGRKLLVPIDQVDVHSTNRVYQ
jgi:hypothetical protein